MDRRKTGRMLNVMSILYKNKEEIHHHTAYIALYILSSSIVVDLSNC